MVTWFDKLPNPPEGWKWGSVDWERLAPCCQEDWTVSLVGAKGPCEAFTDEGFYGYPSLVKISEWDYTLEGAAQKCIAKAKKYEETGRLE